MLSRVSRMLQAPARQWQGRLAEVVPIRAAMECA
jgi:hypothetical protein